MCRRRPKCPCERTRRQPTVVEANRAADAARNDDDAAGAAHADDDRTSLTGTDHAAIARGFGCHGERVERPEDVAPGLARALASGQPAVLDCRTRFVPHPAMPAFGAMYRYGYDALEPSASR